MERMLSTAEINSKLFLLRDYNREKVFARSFPLRSAQIQTQTELLMQARRYQEVRRVLQI